MILTIGALALGVVFAPKAVPTGIAIGVVNLITMLVSLSIINKMGWLHEDKDSEYEKFLLKNPLAAALIGPALEEGIFRGCIQPLIARSVLYVIPTAAAAFLGTRVSVAVAISIVVTAILFGAVHLDNKHKAANAQAVVTGILGITFGICAAQLGLVAAIAAHVVSNTIVVAILLAGKKSK